MADNIIAPQEVLAVRNNADVRIIDARSGADIGARFAAAHLEKALHIDLEKDLAKKETDVSFGGRHPLPPLDDFCTVLGKLGIQKHTRVFVYDDKNGANAAARFWWMMKALGHEHIQVIDGGYDAALKVGFPVSDQIIEVADTGKYPATAWLLPVVSLEEMDAAVLNKKTLIIDVREAYRYNGESEPIDLVAGHIPSAVNIPYLENLDANGNFLPENILREKYQKILDEYQPDEVILHCGSGVTACHSLLALEQAGIMNSKLYVGSWSEWSRRNREIVTETKK